MLRIIGNKAKNSLVSKLADSTGVYTISDVARYRNTAQNRVSMFSLTDLQQRNLRVSQQLTEADIWPRNWYNMLYMFDHFSSTAVARGTTGDYYGTQGSIYGTTKSPDMGANDIVFIPLTTSAYYPYFIGNSLLSSSRRRYGTLSGITHIIVPSISSTSNTWYPSVVRLVNSTNTSKLVVPEIEQLISYSMYEYSKDGTKLVASNTQTFVYFTRTGENYTKQNAPDFNFTSTASVLSFNHDGSKLFAATKSAVSGTTSAYIDVYDMSGITPTKIAHTFNLQLPEQPFQIEFTPDGNYVIFVCRVAGILIYRINNNQLTRTNLIKPAGYLLTTQGAVDTSWRNVYAGLTISPNGKYFSYSIFVDYTYDPTLSRYSTYYPSLVRFVVAKLDATTGIATQMYEDVGTGAGTNGSAVFDNNSTTLYNLGYSGQLTEYSILENSVDVVLRTTPNFTSTPFNTNMNNDVNRRDLHMF